MLFAVIYLILITPVNVVLDAAHDKQTDFTLLIRLWGIGFTLRFRSLRDHKGHHLVFLSNNPNIPPRQPEDDQRLMIMLGTLLRTNKARSFLFSHLCWQHIGLRLRIGMTDAAKTALLSGLAAGLLRIAAQRLRCPSAFHIQPDFLHSRTQVHARCILFFHLGTIIITAAMVLWAMHLETLEHRGPAAKEA